jgi:membrane protein implicated in regulation of membrane protease activity
MGLFLLILILLLALLGVLKLVLGIVVGVALGVFLAVVMILALIGWRVRRALMGPRRGRRSRSRVEVLDRNPRNP